MKSRKPTKDERRLIAALVAKAPNLVLPTGWLDALEVQPLQDGGMGSLRLNSPTCTGIDETFARQASELVFEDADGTKVIASLNLGRSGLPFELDVWKTDFSPLVRIPDELADVP